MKRSVINKIGWACLGFSIITLSICLVLAPPEKGEPTVEINGRPGIERNRAIGLLK